MEVRSWRPTTVECPNECHRAPLASRCPGDGGHRDIERGKVGPDRTKSVARSSRRTRVTAANWGPIVCCHRRTSRRSRHRFGPVLASPALCPREPGRPRGVKQAAPYGARSDTRPLSASSPELSSLRSAFSGKIMSDLMFILKLKQHLHLSAISGYPPTKRSSS